ncbi:MAG: hypothetical protein WC565_10280 [Parcubacteria group bacterium]|jgi:hypothetical protein
MATNLQLVRDIIAGNSREQLEQAALNMAQRLDIVAMMKPESRVGDLQILTTSKCFLPQLDSKCPEGHNGIAPGCWCGKCGERIPHA